MFPATMNYVGIEAQYVTVHFAWNIIWCFISRNSFAYFIRYVAEISRIFRFRQNSVYSLNCCKTKSRKNFFFDTWLFSLRSHSLCEGLIFILSPFFLLSFSLAEFVLLSRPCVKYICFACPCLNSSSNFLNFLPSFVCETFTTC